MSVGPAERPAGAKARRKPVPKCGFDAVFTKLRAVLEPYGKKLTVVHDEPNLYYVDGLWAERWKKVMTFGAVRLGKTYVSYHLVPVYTVPGLAREISPALKRRMQGKACFNFTAVDAPLFAELAELTKKGYERYRAEGWA
jgi:hypothetical protein